MAAYNSYEEAKIANPKCEIYKLVGSGLFDFCAHINPEVVKFTEHGSDGIKCNPADYCMTVDKFLADGYKFVKGDLFLGLTGVVMVDAGRHLDSMQAKQDDDSRRFILRAAALEGKPSENVEWVNGDECEIEMQEGVRRYLFGCECPNNQRTCIVFTKDGGGHMVMPIERLSKPETKQQREGRERLENGKAFYELMSEIEISIMNPEDNGHPNQWDELRDEWQQVYILQAEKLNYLKEV